MRLALKLHTIKYIKMKHQSTLAESVGAFLLGGIYISATIGAALKKIAVAILTNKNALKKALTVILIVLLVILMPVIAIVSFFSGGISVDTAGLSQKIEAQLTAEERAKILIIYTK